MAKGRRGDTLGPCQYYGVLCLVQAGPDKLDMESLFGGVRYVFWRAGGVGYIMFGVRAGVECYSTVCLDYLVTEKNRKIC